MAGVITHVYIARKLLDRNEVSVENPKAYFLGSIAPDAVMSKVDYHRDDKKKSHLRIDISSDDWYLNEYKELFSSRIIEFYTKHILDMNNSFALGYLVHLLTDQAFHYTFRLDIMECLRDKGLPNSGRQLMLAMVHELDTLDYYLLDKNQTLLEELWIAKETCYNLEIKDLIESESLCKNYEWIESKYRVSNKKMKFQYYNEVKLKGLIDSVINHIIETLESLTK